MTFKHDNAIITIGSIVKVGKMMAKRRLKKNVKIGLIALAGTVVITTGIIIGVKKNKEHQKLLASYEYKLENHGYKDEALEYLLSQDDTIKDLVLEKDYNEHLVDFFKQ